MVRPKICRRVRSNPDVVYFKPQGVPMRILDEVVLALDEYEAIRLKDMEGLDQETCAKKMNISQPTFHRLVLGARKKISSAIIKGKAIKIVR